MHPQIGRDMSGPLPKAVSAASRWLIEDWQWPYAGAVTAGFLFVIFPLLWSAAGLALALVFLQLPVYLVHQVEEHAADRFRVHMNETIGRGHELLTRPIVFWTNALLVWVLFLAVLVLGRYVEGSLGLVVVYLTGLNALTHIAGAVVARAYNPGLWTAIALMVPAAAAATLVINATARPGPGVQLLAIATAVGAHAALAGLILSRMSRPPQESGRYR
jgi:hypothetical protein